MAQHDRPAKWHRGCAVLLATGTCCLLALTLYDDNGCRSSWASTSKSDNSRPLGSKATLSSPGFSDVRVVAVRDTGRQYTSQVLRKRKNTALPLLTVTGEQISNGHSEHEEGIAGSSIRKYQHESQREGVQSSVRTNRDCKPVAGSFSEADELAPSIVIGTGASTHENHACWLLNLLKSLECTQPSLTVIVYDLGFSESPLDQSLLSDVHKGAVVLRKFPYDKYPAHFRVDRNAGQYSWKPAIIKELTDEFGAVLWLDAGNKVDKDNNITAVLDTIKSVGFYSPASVGTATEWTHPQMFRYFGVQDTDILGWDAVPNCNGAVVGFSRDSLAYKKLLLPWFNCANELKCIAPPGSNRSNHRQDQAALTVLAHQGGFTCFPFCQRGCGGVLLHQDGKGASRRLCRSIGLKSRLREITSLVVCF